MVESFLLHCLALLGVFRKAIQSSYSVENLLTPVSAKRDSTADVITGIFILDELIKKQFHYTGHP